jgi:type IV secretory pathway TraG/TraD family ATPase VirD4
VTTAIGGGSSSSSTTDSSNWTRTNGASEAQRQLAYPDELMVLKGHQQIVFVENLDPIPAEKILWYENATLKKLGVDLHAGSKPKAGGKIEAQAGPVPLAKPEPAPARAAQPQPVAATAPNPTPKNAAPFSNSFDASFKASIGAAPWTVKADKK